MKKKYSVKYDKNIVQKSIEYMLNGEDRGEITIALLAAHIAISFGTGWQKRATE